MPLSNAKSNKLLIITSSGGGGLIQTANAKEQEARNDDPSRVIVRKDIMKDWIWKWLGAYCVNRWNGAQMRGDVAAQMFCISSQKFAEYLFWPSFFFGTLAVVYKHDIDHVIDTQPMGTSAMIKALRVYNFLKKKKVLLEKVLVDLPTKKATHFFRPIKFLSRGNRPYLRLTTIAPLLDEGQTSEDFWMVNCKLTPDQVRCEDVYVRQAFKKFQGKSRAVEPVTLRVRFKTKEEMQWMSRSIDRGSIHAQIMDCEVRFQILPHHRVITVLLGSQPANEATMNYVAKFIQIARESNTVKDPIHLFVFCGEHKDGEASLLTRVADLAFKTREYPRHLSIIPFSFQDEDVIAPLFFRSDLTCTRSGGQTAMELMCVSRGEIWIHSEAKQSEKELAMDDLLKGIPGWEAANAVYLQKTRGAKIVTPEIFAPHARRSLRASSGPGFASRSFD